MPSNERNENSKERFSEKEVQLNRSTICNNRYEGNFVSANVINLSSSHLFKDEVPLLLEGLKSVTTPKHINKAKIKEEIEVYGKKLKLMWHVQNDDGELDIKPLKKKSKFNPEGDAVIEIYLGRLEEDV